MAYLSDSRVKWLVIHYSATAIEVDVSVEDIDRMHRARGFTETGYHRYLRKSGVIETGRDLSKPGMFEQGAHSKGENIASIGICYEGGVTRAEPNKGFDSRTDAQTKAMIRVIDDLLIRYPNAKVIGHRDMPGAATQCPGFDASAWWAKVQAGRAPKPQHWLITLIKSIFGGRK